MIKWADYLISAVRFEETVTTKHISQVKVHEDRGQEITNAEIWTREAVMNALDKGNTIKTIVIGNNGWKEGGKVFKIKIGNDHYIKTKSDDTTKDNLDILPTF